MPVIMLDEGEELHIKNNSTQVDKFPEKTNTTSIADEINFRKSSSDIRKNSSGLVANGENRGGRDAKLAKDGVVLLAAKNVTR